MLIREFSLVSCFRFFGAHCFSALRRYIAKKLLFNHKKKKFPS